MINFELPNVSEQYVHRIGRTARAGAAGIAIAYLRAGRAGLSQGHREADPPADRGGAAAGQLHAEANRIKATRTAAPEPSRDEREEERRRFPPQRAQRGRGRYASAVKPMGDSRRRAAGR